MDELRDRYHVGHHPPGHLADGEPACFDEWWLAANYLMVLMTEYGDADDEAAYVVIGDSPAPRELLLDDGYPRMRAHVDAVLQDDPPQEDVVAAAGCLVRGAGSRHMVGATYKLLAI